MNDDDQIIITKNRLIADLHNLGVAAGQTIMLHSSVKTIGWIIGGPDVILQALLEVLTSTGTLLMLVGWDGCPYELDKLPFETQQLYLAECPASDPLTSRADHRELGILAEYLRTRNGAVRSNNPVASFAAIGAKAVWLTENHPLNYGYGLDSPLARLHAVGGKVLSVGAPLNTVTLLHYAEYLAALPNKRTVRYKVPILQNGQTIWLDLEDYDTTYGIVNWDGPDYFEVIVQKYVETGKGLTGKVGHATAYLFEAVDITEFGVKWMEHNLK